MTSTWREVFERTLGRMERNYVSELIDARNRWAHQEPFSTDDAYRALDSAERLLHAISAGEQAAEVDQMKHDLQRRRSRSRRAGDATAERRSRSRECRAGT